ncbi:MAG: SWIM zinc finger family protein, partial [Neisseria sp.]|nr:SWIM zinc finger family protein [Neisseria sp.]
PFAISQTAMTQITTAQVLQLAPDDSSIKAAKSLGIAKWPLLAFNGQAVWGHCQGSGKNPYQTAADLSDFTTKCSCPSRKFPCKHGLALLLHFAEQQGKFTADAPSPDWVAEWLEKRGKAQEKRAAKAAGEEAKAADPAEQQKRAAARLKKVKAGMADLRLWLNDVLRNGLMHLDHDKSALYDMAKRMVDAQSPAVSGQLQQLAALPVQSHEEMLYRLGKLHLITQALEKLDTLPQDWQDEIRARIGFPVSRDSVLQQPPQQDEWISIGVTSEEIERGRADSYWLYGKNSRRFACILEFVIKGAPAAAPAVLAGSAYDGALCFYPGVHNLRALAQDWQIKDEAGPEAAAPLQAAWQKMLEEYAANPLQAHLPFFAANLTLLKKDGRFALSGEGFLLPVALDEKQHMELLLACEDRPFSAFLLHDFNRRQTDILSCIGRNGRPKLLSQEKISV